LPHGIEHRLENVGKSDQRLKSENSGAAFDRMNGAEDRVDGVFGIVALLDVGKSNLRLLQQLTAFLEEGQF
jgi:hypothetical protein